MKKGKEKRRTITLKKGEKGLKNASVWAINSKKPIFREKKLNLKRGPSLE